MIHPIDSHSVYIDDATDLEEVVSVNSSIDLIYFYNDIALIRGITIHPDRTSLTLDGKYPVQEGQIHSFTDIESTFTTSTLGIRATSSITITIRNMVINGYNYYGVPYISPNDSFGVIDTSNVSVIYENVRYRGPQLAYNRFGFTKFLDCDIEIAKTGSAQSQEVGEVCRVELGGNTTIYHTSDESNRAVFYFNNTTSNSSLTVLTGADVKITSEYSYFMYNYNLDVSYTIQSGARLDLTVYKGISFDAFHTLNSFLVGSGASFRYVQTGVNGLNSALYLNGTLRVNHDAVFSMQSSTATAPLLNFSGTSSRSITLDNPGTFLLYSPNVEPMHSIVPTPLDLRCGQLNIWYSAKVPFEEAGGFDDITPNKWFKNGYASTLEITGSFSNSSTSVTTNLGPEDDPYPDTSTMQFQNARVISAGDWPVVVDQIYDDGRSISGTTQPKANIKAEYTTEGGTEHSIISTAGENGVFKIPTVQEDPTNVPAGTEVAIHTNIPFLIKKNSATSIYAGELSIESAPLTVVFKIDPVTRTPLLLPRLDYQAPVIVLDDRPDGTRWRLLAAVTGPLTSQDGHVLEDAVVFRYFDEEDLPVLIPLSSTPVEVYTGSKGPARTTIRWEENEGILVRISEPLHLSTEYETTLNWTLQIIDD